MERFEPIVFQIGAWKSFYELEESMTLLELIAAYDGIQLQKFEDRKFQLAMAGADVSELENSEGSKTSDQIKQEALIAAGIKQEFGHNAADEEMPFLEHEAI